EAIGYVYNLKSVNDFEGTYTAIEAGGGAGGGKDITRMKNGSGGRITPHPNHPGPPGQGGAPGGENHPPGGRGRGGGRGGRDTRGRPSCWRSSRWSGAAPVRR